MRALIRAGFLSVASSLGLEVRRLRHSQSIEGTRRQLARSGKIGFLLDVGANDGEYSRLLRSELGYRGPIVSFEPLSGVFAKLEAASRNDPEWRALNHALGAVETEATIHVAGNSYSSSLLPMLDSHREALPQSTPVGSETIRVRRLDDVMSELPPWPGRGYLKIDTQGFEAQVLEGGAATLRRIDYVEMELSLVPLYAGQALFPELCTTMRGMGFVLRALEPAFRDGRTGELLQLDGLFVRGASHA